MKIKFSILISGLLLINNVLYSQWSKTAGPEGFTSKALFNYHNKLYCTVSTKGVYVSNNNGVSWMPSNAGIIGKVVECFAADSTYLYIGLQWGGVWRSPDDGLTWQPIGSVGVLNGFVTKLLYANGFLFAGTSGDGIYRSADQGNTWVNISDGTLDFTLIDAMIFVNPNLIVEADGYLWTSITNGGNWVPDQGTTAFWPINNFINKGDTIIASTSSNFYFRSVNGGNSWGSPTLLDSNLLMADFDQRNDTVFLGTSRGVYYSTTWGASWTKIPPVGLRTLNGNMTDFVISENNFVVSYLFTGNYISSDNGVTWNQCPMGDFDPSSEIYSMLTVNNKVLAASYAAGVYTTTDQGATYTRTGTANFNDTLTNSVVFQMVNPAPNVILAAGGGVWRSADNGATWNLAQGGLPPPYPPFYNFTGGICVSGSNVIAATSEGVYYSSDYGLTWQLSNVPAGNPNPVAEQVAANNNVVIAFVHGQTSFQTGIYRSTDYGVNFTFQQMYLDINRLRSDGNQTFWLSFSTGLSAGSDISDDNGLTWSPIFLGANDIGADFYAMGNHVFAANGHGVWHSTDVGHTFVQENAGLNTAPFNGNYSGYSLTADNQYLYLGTSGDAVWKRLLSDFGITTGLVSLGNNASSALFIYPNPSNGQIFFSLNKDASIDDELKIFNSVGTEVMTLQRNENAAILVDLLHLPDGIYMAVYQSVKGINSQKFVLDKKH